MNDKKILFISHDPFSMVGSNGKTYQSLFSEFEDKNVAQLFFNNLEPSSTKFNNYFKVTDISILKKLFLFKRIDGKTFNDLSYELKPAFGKRTAFKTELIKIIRNFLFSVIHVNKVKDLNKWIEDFKPDVILFLGANYLFQYRTLLKISKQYNIPYYIYFTDDYFLYNGGNNFLTKFLHRRFVSKAKEIIGGAKELFVIGPKMKQEYEEYFSKKCTVLINSVDKEEVPASKNKLGDPIIFRFFGWLHSNRASSLEYLGQCLKYINDNFHLNCILEVYTLSELTERNKTSLANETIRTCKPVSEESLIETMTLSDFLIYAEGFTKKDIQTMMLSVSTKIPEYLLSNRCIIAIGPPELASISTLQNNSLAITLTQEKSIEENALQILEVIENRDKYNLYCSRAIQYCRNEFDSTKMRKSLKDKLSQVK